MMKRLYIIVEGQTEQEFVKSILSPYLFGKGIVDVRPILIETSKSGKGGFVRYQHLYNTVNPLLKSHKDDFLVTTLIDFFRIPNDIPAYDKAKNMTSHKTAADYMQEAIDADIDDMRFFSYIQLHEFEALLFSSNAGFENYFDVGISEKTNEIIAAYQTPEDINSSPTGAPSKRILSIITNYNKVIFGNLIAMEIGISTILEKCPRFREWIDKILILAECKGVNSK